MRTIGPKSLSVYAKFDMFPDMALYLESIGAKEYWSIDVIIFKCPEDILFFRIKFGV